MTPPPPTLPYRIAVLLFLFDEQGHTLLLHRSKPPNQGMYSPVGGKLEQGEGESPTACAVRELWEETRLRVEPHDLHLTGIVSEAAYEGQTHWLMFLYELNRAVSREEVEHMEFDEGRLEWHPPEAISTLSIPESDRDVIWPLFHAHRGSFFMAHIDCRGERISWRVEQGGGENPNDEWSL